MTRDFLKANPAKELEAQINADLNIFVREALTKLSRKSNPYSPIDTGFFASSWTVGRSRPLPQDARESFAPWNSIKPKRDGTTSPQSRVEPRFIDNINYNFKIFERFYIGNRAKYSAYALASSRNHIVRYFKQDFKFDMDRIFRDKKSKIGLALEPFKGGQGGIGQFANPDKTFVSYTNISDIPDKSN
tara:strand:- start:297 stop:860 length:564 start_codon:yes stop_codon:yes gene_type:complete